LARGRKAGAATPGQPGQLDLADELLAHALGMQRRSGRPVAIEMISKRNRPGSAIGRKQPRKLAGSRSERCGRPPDRLDGAGGRARDSPSGRDGWRTPPVTGDRWGVTEGGSETGPGLLRRTNRTTTAVATAVSEPHSAIATHHRCWS